jgi:hypothetical protein
MDTCAGPTPGRTAMSKAESPVPAESWPSGDGPLCDRCADARLVVLAGPDGRERQLRYRDQPATHRGIQALA